jgi:O-antigen/teichoic acid export membrane protein
VAAEGPGDPPADDANLQLGRAVGRGLRWSLFSTALARLGALVSGIVLARLLEPTDYGLYTVAFVALVLLANINDIGLETTLVRWPVDVATVARTATTVIFGASVLLFGAAFFAAPFLARSLRAPEAAGIIRLLAFCVVVNGAFAVPSAMLTRSFRQDKRAAADVAGFVLSTAVTIALAVAGYGAWSLAWGRLVGNLANGLLHLALAPARYRPGFDAGDARKLVSAGLPIAGALLTATAVYNIDYVIVGRYIGPAALGLYVMAFNLSSWPVSMFTESVGRVSVAGFARLQLDLPSLRAAFTRSLTLLMAAAVPVCVLVAVLADPLVRFVYGDRWSPAAQALRFLIVLGLIRVAFHLAYDLLVAVGRGRAALGLHLLWLAALVPALAVGTRAGGIRGAGIAHMAVAATVVLPALLVLLRGLGIRVTDLARSVARPVAGGLVAAAVALGGLRLVTPELAQLAVAGTLGLGAYLLVVAPLRHRPELRLRRPGPRQPVAVEPA